MIMTDMTGNKFVLFSLAVVLLFTIPTWCDQKSFDCKMRQLAMDFARKIQPMRTKEQFQQLADALNGAKEAQHCNVTIGNHKFATSRIGAFAVPQSGSMFYVDAAKGSDSNSGTQAAPFKTLEMGVASAKKAGPGSTVILRKGVYYLDSTVDLTSKDSSGISLQSFNGEEACISGGKAITPKWMPHNVTGANIYVADLSQDNMTSVLGLRVNGKRAIRARFPNSDPEFGFGSSMKAKSWTPPTLPSQPDKEVNPDMPFRNSSGSFQKYQLGIGGPCKYFMPPAGYWCGSHTGGGGAATYKVPSGMIADKSVLPNSPYKDAVGAIIQTWRPSHWASWMFEVGEYDPDSGKFMFSKGGFQGARGNSKGAEFYIENVFEELDSPNEWFYDTKSKMLYFWYNGTGAPPKDTVFEITNLKTLFNVTGTQQNPIRNISFKGVMFKDTAYTYMDPHGMPSGGDWALQRMGALFFEGTENVMVDSCVFESLDGNAVMISGYNRDLTIQNSEFVWIGDTAIGSWGYTTGAGVDGMGPDGTDGNQPRFNKIINNFVHELGIWEKQSSFYFQAKSCQNLLMGNIFFNGPRAGVNFNDGFGGGSNLTENLLLNTCRESGDHGPFNSWDRQVFVTKVRDGHTPSPEKAYDHISGNFMIANYNSQEAIDNDDGSNYYMTHGNFFVYSGNGMKNDFGGHDNHHFNNVYAFIGHGFRIVGQLKGHEDYFYNNTVVMNGDGDYGNPTCKGDGKTVVHDNKIYTPSGKVTECGMSLKDWQAKGNDPGTTAAMTPDDMVIIDAARHVLGLTG